MAAKFLAKICCFFCAPKRHFPKASSPIKIIRCQLLISVTKPVYFHSKLMRSFHWHTKVMQVPNATGLKRWKPHLPFDLQLFMSPTAISVTEDHPMQNVNNQTHLKWPEMSRPNTCQRFHKNATQFLMKFSSGYVIKSRKYLMNKSFLFSHWPVKSSVVTDLGQFDDVTK